MGATSIHVQAVKPGSEIHNFREKELDYVRPELSHLNESWVGDSISHRLESAKQRYLDTVGQKMQAKAAPIREGVIVIKQETTMQELQQFFAPPDHIRHIHCAKNAHDDHWYAEL